MTSSFNLNDKYIQSISSGCGRTSLSILFSDPCMPKPTDFEKCVSNTLSKCSYTHIKNVQLTYFSKWMGSDEKTITLTGTCWIKDHVGFIRCITDESQIEGMIFHFIITPKVETADMLGLSDIVMMYGGTSADMTYKDSDHMLWLHRAVSREMDINLLRFEGCYVPVPQ